MRKPTTNPKIEGKPMSFVKLKSSFETPLRLVVKNEMGELERRYEQDHVGTVRRVKSDEQ